MKEEMKGKEGWEIKMTEETWRMIEEVKRWRSKALSSKE